MLILLLLSDDRYQLLAASMAAFCAWYCAVAALVWRWTAPR